MSMTIEIDDRLVKEAFRAAPAITLSRLNLWINKAALMTERESKLQVPPNVDTGRMQSSISTVFTVMQAEIAPRATYAQYIIGGRRPGGKTPPFQEGTPLNLWAKKKGMVPFLVARSIARKGTKANPFMEKAYRIVKPQAEREAQLMLADIVRAI